MNDPTKDLARILRVRQAKLAVARMDLVELAAHAQEAEHAAAQAEAAARHTRIATRERIRQQRDEIFARPFNGEAMGELRQSSAEAEALIARVFACAAELREAAREREAERAATAQVLVKLDGRCTGLERKLKELRIAWLTKRDERSTEDFAPGPLIG